MSCYIAAYGLVSALGTGRDASAEALLAWQQSGVSPLDRHRAPLLDGRLTPVGRVEGCRPFRRRWLLMLRATTSCCWRRWHRCGLPSTRHWRPMALREWGWAWHQHRPDR